jgi:hypothetical protein
VLAFLLVGFVLNGPKKEDSDEKKNAAAAAAADVDESAALDELDEED